MTDATQSADLLLRLNSAIDTVEKAAIVAEFAFARLPDAAALVARRCIILHWFDEAIVAALLPSDGETAERTVQAQTVYQQLEQLPFGERLAWGLAYHDLTRSGLLARYVDVQPELLQAAARLAAPAYEKHEKQPLAAVEALYCAALGNDQTATTEIFERLIYDMAARKEWDGLLALFATLEQAAALPFVQPLSLTDLHWFARGLAQHEFGKLDAAIADYDQAIALTPRTPPPTTIAALPIAVRVI